MQDSRAFVVVRQGEQTGVIDLPAGEPVTIGRAEGSTIRVEGPRVEPTHATLRWDGSRLSLHDSHEGTFLNGKRLQGSAELKPGDEVLIGAAQLVASIAAPLTTGGRRALTHHEMRERLYEEMARAARGGRQMALAMVQAHTGDGGQLATAALDTVRGGDLVGTFAHDEIELLLPDTPGDVAQTVIERVRERAGVPARVGLAVAPGDGDNPERLIWAARRALESAAANTIATALDVAATPATARTHVQPMTEDEATAELMQSLEGRADDGPVLITGEVGSGKGVFARVLHDRSQGDDAPFVTIRCASLMDEQDAEKAFGEGGEAEPALSGGGTLLLDEVGDLVPQGQPKLRALLERAGDGVRVVATTHRALGGLVERGAFDAELGKRLRGEPLEVPPLRNRPEDIIPLAERFAEELGAQTPVRMTPGALARLRSYPWPGNVLELRNAMERAVRLAGGGEILAEHLPAEALPYVPGGEGRLREHVDGVERDAIIKALADSNHNQTHAAKRLGISRRALIYKMEKYGLKLPPASGRRA